LETEVLIPVATFGTASNEIASSSLFDVLLAMGTRFVSFGDHFSVDFQIWTSETNCSGLRTG
jgi:hypothetical protein